MNPPTRLAVFISGTGRLLAELIAQQQAGRLPVEIVGVLSSSPSAPGLQHAADAGIASTVIHQRDAGGPAARDELIARWLIERDANAIVLAGYLAKFAIPDLPAFNDLRQRLEHRVMNIHPALLPSFGGAGMFGRRVHEAVLTHGCKVSGCTVHLVDEHYDTGPIVTQRAVDVLDDDTPESLAARVFEQEKLALVEAVGWLAQGRLRVAGRRVMIDHGDVDSAGR